MTTQGTETRSAETTGSARKGDGPVAESDAPDRPDATDYRNRAERAEAECKELRERLANVQSDLTAVSRQLAIELAASQHGAG